jgi:hypothetical protein
VIADGQNDIEWLVPEFVHVFRTLAGDVDPDLMHDSDGFGEHGGRLGARAFDVEFVAGVMPQKSHGHLAARRITSAENQYAKFVHSCAIQRKRAVAQTAPTICAAMNAGASCARMPEKVSDTVRASVTAGLAKDVDAVNQ